MRQKENILTCLEHQGNYICIALKNYPVLEDSRLSYTIFLGVGEG